MDSDQYGSWHAYSLQLERQSMELKGTDMGITLKRTDSGQDFVPAPYGTHAARLIKIVDLGTQKTTFQGKEKSVSQIYLQWELVDALMDDGNPFVIGNRYTRSMNENANLRKMLEGWRGKTFTDAEIDSGFSLSMLLGKACMVGITHTEKGERVFANIKSVSAVPASMPVKPAKNPTVDLSLDEEFNAAEFDKLSDFFKGLIMASPEYQALNTEGEVNYQPEDDEIPF